MGRQGDGEIPGVKKKIVSHRDLEVYRRAFQVALRFFELSKSFPKEETYSLSDQARRSSRSVCSQIAEAWRKRIYSAAFAAKLNDAEGEAAETQVWVEFAARCSYISREDAAALYSEYEAILAMLVDMRNSPNDWVISQAKR